MMTLLELRRLLETYQVHGLRQQVILLLAEGLPLTEVAERCGIGWLDAHSIRNGIYSQYPIIEEEIRPRRRRLKLHTKAELLAMRTNDRAVLKAALRELVASRIEPRWDRATVASLGLELLEVTDLPGESDLDMVQGLYQLYGIPYWISHKRCKVCKVMKEAREYHPGSQWRLNSDECRECHSRLVTERNRARRSSLGAEAGPLPQSAVPASWPA